MPDIAPPWGQHLVLDLDGCPRDKLVDADHLKRWLRELIDTIDMKAYGEPAIEHFATHSFEAAGFTVMQMIETSNISAHFAENLGQAYIDIFSCKTFDNDAAIMVCRRYFEPAACESTVIQRGTFSARLSVAS